MRLVFKQGKQKELVLNYIAREKLNISSLARTLKVSRTTVLDWIKEKNLMSSERYNIFDKKKQFKKHILEEKEDNWGRSKGGKNSPGSTFHINSPKKDKNLAEFLGILFGDGNSYKKKDTKIGVYSIRITGDSRYDKNYLNKFVKKLAMSIFRIKGKSFYYKEKNVMNLNFYSKELVNELEILGFPSGNKIKNKLKIPEWIKINKTFFKSFMRGLIDTDGSIFRMSNKDPQLLRISFTNFIPGFLDQVREELLGLGFHPSKIISNKHIFLSRKEDIKKYIQKIGFSNEKHINRLKKLRRTAP